MDAQELTLLTICKGAVPEIFAHELMKVVANIADPNTSATKPRKVTMEFVIQPFPDRSGASVSLTCKATLGSLDASGVTGSIYLAKRDGKYTAFSRDLRQEMLFSGEEEEVIADGKTAAANP
jgi:hypothetical protein